MHAEKFKDFAVKFNAASYKLPILLVEQIAKSESQDNVFKTMPSNKAVLLLMKQGRTLGTKPLENAEIFSFHHFERSINVGISLGRAETNKITLPDNAVSKMHASIKLNHKGEWQIVDVESENGTMLNGQKLESNKRVVLKNGDGVTVADTFHCTFFTVDGFKEYLDSIV